MVQMMRVHAPEKNCCRSRQPDSGRFAPRGFASRAEDKETAGEHKPFPLDFDMMSLPIFPPVQAKLADGNSEDGQENAEPENSQQEPNRTGMPDRLKAGIEALSGFDMSDVRVHANSERPARLNALAYTQGNQIYMGPGQERHLPHEAWHAVQQKQGRVRATGQMKGVGVNDEAGLEKEAKAMGRRAMQLKDVSGSNIVPSSNTINKLVTQMVEEVMMIGNVEYNAGTRSDIFAGILEQPFLSELQRVIIDRWIVENDKFENVSEFREELSIAERDWTTQQHLYTGKTSEDPLQYPHIGRGAHDNQESTEGRYMRLYTARMLEEVIKIKKWAVNNGIDALGFHVIPQELMDATELTNHEGPAKGHLGDRATAEWHFSQKSSGNGRVGLLMFELNNKGTTATINELKDFKRSGKKSTSGSQGYVEGKQGYEKETGSISVALSGSVKTWELFKTRIQRILLIRLSS